MGNETIKKVMNQAFFNPEVFGEEINYNGKTIIAIVEIGESEQEHSPAFMRQPNAVTVSGAGCFSFSLNEVPEPKKHDKIVYNGKTYYVSKVLYMDTVGGNVTVSVSNNERGYVRGRNL